MQQADAEAACRVRALKGGSLVTADSLQRSSIRHGRVRNKLPDASPMERVRAAVHSPRTGYRHRPSEARSMNDSVSGQVEVAASALDRGAYAAQAKIKTPLRNMA
ncbi:hypothetical protein [Methylorubrum extorquens]